MTFSGLTPFFEIVMTPTIVILCRTDAVNAVAALRDHRSVNGQYRIFLWNPANIIAATPVGKTPTVA